MYRFILWGLFVFIIAALPACQIATPETATQQPVSPTPTILPTNTLVPPSPTPSTTPTISTPTATPTVVIEPTAAPTRIPTVTPAPTIPASSRTLDLSLVAHTGGAATGLVLADNGRLAYMSVGPRLLLYDVADRQNPQLRWQSEPFAQPFVTLVREGEYLFGRLLDRWVVWQISTTAMPMVVWESQAEATATGGRSGSHLHLSLANKLYLRASTDDWLVFDPQAAAFPLETITQTGHIQPVDGGLIIEQRTADGYDLFFAEGQTLPANVVSQMSFAGSRQIIAIHEPYLYVRATSVHNSDGLVINFADFAQPELLSDELPFYFPAIVHNNWLMTIYGDSAVYDITEDPVNPLLLAYIKIGPMSDNQPLHWQGDQLLLLSRFSDAGYLVADLVLLNLDDVFNPEQQRQYQLPALRATAVERFEDTLFVLQNAQLTMLDIADFEKIQELGRIEMVGPAFRILLTETGIFISAQNYNDRARFIPAESTAWPATVAKIPVIDAHGFYLHRDTLLFVRDAGIEFYNLSTHETNSMPFNELVGWVGQAKSWQEYLYVLSNDVLTVLEMADPVNPTIVAKLTITTGDGWWNSMAIANSVAFIGGPEGITVIDLSNPVEPVEIAYTAVGEYIGNLHVVGHALYGGQRNFFIFDISDPAQPQFVRTMGTSINGQPYKDFLIGTIDGDIAIFDVADPFNPTLVKQLSLGTVAHIMGIRENHLYVGSDAGIYVFEIKDSS
jgi:hypothetical protein